MYKVFTHQMQIIASFVNNLVIPPGNYYLIRCQLFSHQAKLSLVSTSQTMMNIHSPQVSSLPLAAEVALWSVAEKAVEGWLQLQERYHDRLPR